jgi:uncharacterized protein with GYD domain
MKVAAKMPYQVTEPGGKVVEKVFTVGNYRPAFIVSGAACAAAAAVVLLALKSPKGKA